MAKRKALKYLVLHNVVSPYRLPVFEEINRHLDLTVYFCKFKTADRKWHASMDGFSFASRVLPSVKLGPFYLNPTLLWHLLRERFDVYLVGDFPEMMFATFVTIAVAKLRRKPVVLWSETIDHGINYYPHLVTSMRRRDRLTLAAMTRLITWYRRFLLKLPDHFVALSNLAREFLRSEGISDERMDWGLQVMPKELMPAPDTPKARSPYAGKKVLYYIGYINHLKGIDRLIRAMKQLDDADLRLVIAGSGPEEDRLKAMAAGDKRIIFNGWTESHERANLYSWANIFATPTLADCWGLTVNEALYYGVPVITTDVAGASELLNGGGGIVVPANDDAALVAAIRKMLDDTRSYRRMKAAAKASRDTVSDSRAGAKPILAALKAAGGAK